MGAVLKQDATRSAHAAARRTEWYRVGVSAEVRAALDALRDEVAVVDRRGVIVFVNRAWHDFADLHGFDGSRHGFGEGYLTVCDEARGADADDARQVAAGLRAVLAGERAEFAREYACAAPDKVRWFQLRATRFELGGAMHALITHADISPLKGMEETLRFSLGRFQAFMDNSPAAAFLKDRDGRLVWVNERFAQHFGRRSDEMLGLSDAELLPESAAQLRRNDVAALAAKEPLQVFEMLRTPDGVMREWLVMKFPVRDVTAQRFVGGIAVDVTAQRQATALLRESEARLRLIAEQLPAIAITTDRSLRFTSVSGAGLATIGLAPEQLVGRTAEEAFGAEPSNRAALDALPRALAGESLGLEAEWAGRAFQVRFEPLRDAAGAIVGTVGVAIDCTERKRVQRERAEGAARIATLANVSRVFAAARLDTQSIVDATVRAISESMHDGCLLSLAEPHSGTLTLLALHHADPAARDLAARLMTEQPWSTSNTLVEPVLRDALPARLWSDDPAQLRGLIAPAHRPYLDRFPVYGTLTVPLRVDGRPIGALAVWRDRPGQPYTLDDEVLLQDLADRAALAIANARLYEQVEQRVSERTHALQLANQELEAFSYSVSHDLRAPLRAIVGFTRALQEDCGAALDADGRRYLQRVRDGGERMEGLIDALLTLSQIKRRHLVRQPVALGALVRDIGDELARAHPHRQVRLMVRSDAAVDADPDLLRIAMENLLGNAWKYTSKRRQATVEFGTRQLSDGPATIYFVRDDGAGFDMRAADKLFDPFQRLHSASEFSGSGIGLATVQRIILRHGGRIWADATPGRGATFYFTLPSRDDFA
jgi:PAS domain S-box-containing protein